jgi:hypothetical protein
MYIYRGSSSPVGKFVRFVQFLRPVEFSLRTVELNLLVLQANKFERYGTYQPDSVTSVTSFSKFPYNKYIHLEPNVFLYRKFRILITLTTQI